MLTNSTGHRTVLRKRFTLFLILLFAILFGVVGFLSIGLQPAAAQSTSQQTTTSILGMIKSFGGRGGGPPQADYLSCDSVYTEATKPVWLFSDSILTLDDVFTLSHVHGSIAAIQCPSTLSQTVGFTLTGPDGIILQEVADKPAAYGCGGLPEVASDCFSYPIYDPTMPMGDYTLEIAVGTQSTISHTFTWKMDDQVPHVIIKDLQTVGGKWIDVRDPQSIEVEFSGFPSYSTLDVVLYRSNSDGLEMIQTRQVRVDDRGKLDALFQLSPSVLSGDYVLVACPTEDCVLVVGWGFELPPIAAAAFPIDVAVSASESSEDVQTSLCTYEGKLESEDPPDDKSFKPGEDFTKRWTIRNMSNCVWALHHSRFGFYTQPTDQVVVQMATSSVVEIEQLVEPGDTVDILLPMIAPTDPGEYRSEWKLYTEEGESIRFGADGQTPLYLEIVVRP